jgi:hypothetical protein
MANWSIHLEEQTATSETGICFKFTEAIPPDDIDGVILSEMRQEALGEFKKVLGK